MFKISIPYLKHTNKNVIDFFLSNYSQLNNVNCAVSNKDSKFSRENSIFLVITNKNKLYFYENLSRKTSTTEVVKEDTVDTVTNFESFFSIWGDIQDIKISEDFYCESTFEVYWFDIKKLFSTVAFASNYKERDKIELCLSDDLQDLVYIIQNKADVILGHRIANVSLLYDYIAEDFARHNSACKGFNKCILSVTNVDKNNFLLPYFDYKNNLRFTVSCQDNSAKIEKVGKDWYFTVQNDNPNQYFKLSTKLDEKRFMLFNDTSYSVVSPALWQILVMLQHNKSWCTANIAENMVELSFSDNKGIFNLHFVCNGLIINQTKPTENSPTVKEDTYEEVGIVNSDELFLASKLFSNIKTSVLDFSKQAFFGNTYIYSETEGEEKTIPFDKQTDTSLPLKISIAEIKHYVGSDLSQKDFTLHVKTDGVNVSLEKYSNSGVMEVCVTFNHIFSKNTLKM